MLSIIISHFDLDRRETVTQLVILYEVRLFILLSSAIEHLFEALDFHREVYLTLQVTPFRRRYGIRRRCAEEPLWEKCLFVCVLR